jgi:hypothetical protein
MTEREEPPYPAGYRPVPEDDWREQTTPGMTPVHGPGTTSGYGSSGYERPGYEQPTYQQPRYEQPRYEQPQYRQPGDDPQGYVETGYGQTGYGETGYGAGAPVATTAPDYSSRPVAVRRPDALAALALLLAGIAAGVSLLLHWLSGREETGWTLLRDGLRNVDGLFRTGMWQPLAIILGGGLLFVLGLLVLVPARAHRSLGFLALLVSAAMGAAVLVPLSAAHWRLGVFDVGFFCGVAAAGLGLLGSLKALLTAPRMRP